MKLVIDAELEARFPGLAVLPVRITGVTVASPSRELEDFKRSIENEIREYYTLETLKDI